MTSPHNHDFQHECLSYANININFAGEILLLSKIRELEFGLQTRTSSIEFNETLLEYACVRYRAEVEKQHCFLLVVVVKIFPMVNV
jgi:hypothetical protein